MKDKMEISKYMLYGALITVVIVAGIWLVVPFIMPSVGASGAPVQISDPIENCSIELTPDNDYIIHYIATGDEDILRLECVVDYGHAGLVFAPYDFKDPVTGDYILHKPMLFERLYGYESRSMIRVSVIRGNDIKVGYYKS
jgi:hypothetical protein